MNVRTMRGGIHTLSGSLDLMIYHHVTFVLNVEGFKKLHNKLTVSVDQETTATCLIETAYLKIKKGIVDLLSAVLFVLLDCLHVTLSVLECLHSLNCYPARWISISTWRSTISTATTLSRCFI